MNFTIYIDVLFLLNLIINYIILCSTALTANLMISKKRLLLAASLGAIYNVVIFFPTFEIFNLVIIKIAFSIIMLIIAFKYYGLFLYLKSILTYYIISAIYGGGMYIFHHFTSLGSKMNYSNGVYYIDMPLWLIITMAFGFYFLIKIFTKISDSRNIQKSIINVKIEFENTNIIVKALVDTGNSLCDPISLMPVMLIESSAFKNKLSNYFLEQVNRSCAESLQIMHKAYPKLKVRIIPFQDISGTQKIVYAFKPQKIYNLSENKEINNTLIGIISAKLTSDESYNALLHTKI